MDKTEIIMGISKKTGINLEICEKVIKTFEEATGGALFDKLKDVNYNKERIIAGLVEKTNITEEDCEKVLNAFQEVLGDALLSKLNFFKKKKDVQ